MPRMFVFLLSLAAFAVPARAQQQPDALASLDFLLGTWSAKAAAGSAGAQVTGTYTFRRDLGGHILSRTSSADSCKAPGSFDCQHHDLLTAFSDPNAAALHHTTLLAFYADSEGHIIYYTVSTPDPHTAVFLSQGAAGAPRFRLTYHLEGDGPAAIMTGRFQMAVPGSDDFHSYLEWTGTKQ